MIERLVFILSSLLIFAVISCAQDSKSDKTSIFKGKVMRSDTKKPVSKVRVLLIDDKKTETQDNSVEGTTDENGEFLIKDVKSGKYTISILASFDKEEDVPCQLLMGKIDEPNSKLIVATDKGKHVEQIFVIGFSIKSGKEIKKDFDLVCKSLFSK